VNIHPSKRDLLNDRTLALAGVFQAAALVNQLAKTGQGSNIYFSASINSLFKIDANDVPDVYGGVNNLRLGLEELVRLFTNQKIHKDPKDSNMARYVLSLLHLERKLAKHPYMQKTIQIGLERANRQAAHFSITHENVMANLAGIYTDTLSTFKFRVYVTGEPTYLNQLQVMNKIRALLFAGIRSSFLWRQLGGRRWQLLISRLRMTEAATQYLQSLPHLEKIS
jgi:high frequency lysogenization protein